MALTEEQRARFNAKSAQKKTQGTVPNNNSDASDYQEFLRFKEMKRQQELQKQAAERQAAMQQQAILRQQQEELRRQQEEIQRQRFELEQEKQAQQQRQYQQSSMNNNVQPQQAVTQPVGKDGLTTRQRIAGWCIFLALICVVYFGIHGVQINKNNSSANQQQTSTGQHGQSISQSKTGSQTEIGASGTESQSVEVSKQSAGNYYSVGDTAVIGGLKITLMDAGFVDPNSMWASGVDEGYGYYYFDFEGQNISEKDMSVSLANFEAYCDDYSLDINLLSGSMLEGKGAFSGDLAAGKKIRGVVTYKVPLDFQKIEVRVVDSYWSSDYAEFAVFN